VKSSATHAYATTATASGASLSNASSPSSASTVIVSSGAGRWNTDSCLGLGEVDVADESDGLNSNDWSEKFRSEVLVLLLVPVLGEVSL